MTDEKQAVKTLAEQLAKAMKSVSANTPSRNYSGGTNPSTIQASKIIGLPAAFSSIISGVESSAAGGDAVAQQTLIALNHIAAGEFETITADTAMIEKVYATFGDFITLVAEDAQIGSLDVDTIRAGLAEVGLLNIGTASIDMAQIKRSSTQTAFIHESVQGKVYIDDLAVNDASIVNLAAGTVLINNPNGELVELYVDSQGNVSTRAVAYDGSDIINQNSLSGNTIINNSLSGDAVIANSLNGNKIVSNSITTTQLNANEIFAYQGTIMDLIADNIEATRLFANQAFITELQSTIISSDLSQNTSFIELTDSINLVAANSSRTFIQENMPIPVHTSDTWFDPTTEEHYVANAVYLPISQMVFGHDDEGNLRNDHSEDYRFTINSDGELMLLVTNEEAGEIIVDNDINFEITNDHVQAGGLWRKVDNVAFSNLKVSVDGIVSEVYDSSTGTSRIEQNADRIIAIVSGDTAVPYVKTSSIEIKENKVEIQSAGDVDIKAKNFSISFNTDGTLTNKSRVDISNDVGIKVSDSYGNYFQATSGKIGLYDIQDNPKLYVDNNGHAFFNGSLTLGGANNVNGSMSVKNANGNTIVLADNSGLRINNSNGTKIGSWSSSGIEVYNSAGSINQFYVDSNTGNATFKGAISLGGSVNGAMTIYNASGTKIGSWSSSGIEVYNSAGSIKQFYIDSTTGNAIFKGTIDNSVQKTVTTTTGDNATYEDAIKLDYGGCSFYRAIIDAPSFWHADSIFGHRFKEAEITHGGTLYIGTAKVEGMLKLVTYTTTFNGNSSEKTSIVLETGNTISINAGTTNVSGDFSVTGTKSRLVSTDQYSNRFLYCYETPSPLFGDVGEGVISSDGKCYISLDPIFAQTIFTDQYQVFLQPYGDGNCYVSERHGSYFVVSGTPNLPFGWELKAKQADVDQLRLERNDEKFSVPSQTYGEDAANHIKELYNERTQQDEENK